MSFRHRFRDNISALRDRKRPHLGQPINKTLKNEQIHQHSLVRSQSYNSSPDTSSVKPGSSKRLESGQVYRQASTRLLYSEIPVQLVASNSLNSDLPVDFSCLLDSPYARHHRKQFSQKICKAQDESSRYVPCRLGGLGSARIGNSGWNRAAEQARRRKDYGNLLRVSWQLRSRCLT